MRKSKIVLSLCNFISFIAISFITILSVQAQCPSGIIEGFAFEDNNDDGIYSGITDDKLSGLIVRIYNSNGNLINQSITNGQGEYSFSGLNDGDRYMVVFDPASGTLISSHGAHNNADVQNVTAPYCNANIGILTSTSNCSRDTDIFLSCFVNSAGGNGGQETIIGLSNDFNGSTAVQVYATQAETGSVWGLAYSNSRDIIYSGAFIKQNTNLGPQGHDAIYATDLATNTTTLLAKLASLGQNAGSLSVSNASDCAYGSQVGKVGIGGIAIDEAGNYLYAVNLFNRSVVKIDLNNTNANTTTSFNIPNPGCTFNDYRPFAIKYHQGKLYLGVTCTAETSLDDNDTEMHVFSLNTDSGNSNLEFSTSFGGGHWNDNPTWKIQSQWLTDIDFTADGDMILAVTDRIGHRYCDLPTNSRVDDQHGDILYVANVNGTWTLENNGSAGNKTGSGVANTDGPNGGEFFGDDYFPANKNDHPEVALGSIAIIPGFDEVITSVFDPMFSTYSGGIHRYSTINGSKISGKELYNRNLSNYFGKATGFGDIIGACGMIDGSIGNLVWIDANNNGIQDAGENGVSNVDLNLYDQNCNLIATTTTNNNGYYYFQNISANKTYYVALDPALFNSNSQKFEINNASYSMASSSGNAQLNSNLGNSAPCLNMPVVEVTGSFGLNPTFDLGLTTIQDFDLALRKTVGNTTGVKKGEIIDFTIEVFNQGSQVASQIQIVDYLTPAFNFNASLNPGWTNANGVLRKNISGTLNPGQSKTERLRLSVVGSSNPADYTNYAEISRAMDSSGNMGDDVDSTPDRNPNNDNGGKNTNDQISDNGTIDEDDHDFEDICVLDLALRNVVRPQNSFNVNDRVIYDLTVFNQGNIATNSFEISAQFPGTLNIDLASNPDWAITGLNVISTNSNQVLNPGDQVTFSVEFNINSFTSFNDILLLAEISGFVSAKPGITRDFDSTPDSDFYNDNGDDSTDNDITGDGSLDEDDADPAKIAVRQFDLALIKTTDKEFVKAGDVVTFDITIYNQGVNPVSSVMLMDFTPQGSTLLDNTWIAEPSDPTGSVFYKNVNFPNGFLPGSSHTEQITLKIDDHVSAGYLVNYSEIGQVFDTNGIDVSGLDIDSRPDKDMLNDAGGLMGTYVDDFLMGTGVDDEDDHDPAGVYLATIEIRDPCVCKNNATNQFNGQFDETVTITAPSGMVWYIDEVINLFDPISAAPPANPTAFVTGALGKTLTEIPLTGGLSEYQLNGLVVDGTSYSIRVTNGIGAFLQISGGGAACVYQDPVITGDGLSAVCAGSEFTYCIDPVSACTAYNWTLSGGGNIIGARNTNCINVRWGSTLGGPHRITMTPSCSTGCVAPAVADVNISVNSGSMSCLSSVNVSLNHECLTTLKPETFLTSAILPGVNYQLMVTDHHGQLVPNNVVTSDYLWETLMAKVVDPCSGNSCWATVNIEDKLAPVIQCDSIEMFCWQVHTYEPLVYDNCSTAEYDLINETTSVYNCNPDYIKEVNRTYVAVDGYGNRSEPCHQQIKLKRLPIDSTIIMWPDSFMVADMTHLTCNDSIYNKAGFPKTSITGVPTLGGRALYPLGEVYCELYVDYDDFLVTDFGCTKKIMRTWTVYENWCSNGTLINYVQVIEVGDLSPPTVECPADMTISTDGTPGCLKSVSVPLPIVTDDCTSSFNIDFSHANGIDFDVTSAPTVTLESGTSSLKYNVYDLCGNLTTCNVNVVVADNVAPVAICDENTAVSLRSNGTAKAFAYTFDDGSYDDCSLHKFLVRKMTANCEDCPVATFDDFTYIGERMGRYYYLSKNTTHGSKAFNYSTAHGGMLLTLESEAECNWLQNEINSAGLTTPYFIGLSDNGHQGQFTWVNHVEPDFNKWLGGKPGTGGSNVITDANGNWVVVNGNEVEAQYVLELSNPCGFSDEVFFCCDDVAEEQMVVFRAIDYFGHYNDCMVSVDVQDKVPPRITCPADMSIACDYPFNMEDLSEFGEAEASDVCGVDMLTTVEEGVNSCGQGMVYRTFAAWDDNDTSSCTQIITLVNPDTFDLNSVDFPDDYFTDQGCNSGELIPENLPEEYAFPSWTEDACALVAATYTDEEFSFAGPDGDACLKILRTWSVIDWCQSDDPGYEPLVHFQTIKVSNITGPQIVSGCDTLRAAVVDCQFADVAFTAIATDDCTAGDRLRNGIRLEGADGSVFEDNNSSSVYEFSGKLPLGEHVAFVSFSDLCGNTTTCAKIIQVINNKPPTAACINGLSVALEPMDFDGDGIPDDEMACISPNMIDASSTHVCGFDIDLSFSVDVFHDKKFFDCEDIGINIVELWVTDEFGNTAKCETTVEVQDNNGVDFCPTFDLALRKTLITPSPYEPGDEVTFNIDIFNQGNTSAYDINIVDYIPDCLILADTDWSENVAGIATLNSPIEFLEDSTMTTVQITMMIDPSCPPQTITNFAEISSADDDEDRSNDPPNDLDSMPDSDDSNDGAVSDNVIDEDGKNGGDEDDHDVANLAVSIFDLAITKVVEDPATIYNPGDNVDFIITVYNQGTVNAFDVVVTDYVPSELIFNQASNSGWNLASAGVVTSDTIPFIAAGSSLPLTITLAIDPTFVGAGIVNNAEITYAENPDGIEDQDDPLDNTNDGTNSELDTDNDIDDESTGGTDNPDDEDDYDPADIIVECDIPPLCSSAADFSVSLNAAGEVSITVADINDGSAPVCIGSTIDASIDILDFDCSNVGSNTVTLTIQDSNGSNSTCTTIVTVEDNIDPTAECQDVMTSLGADGLPDLTSVTIVTRTDDNCGVVNVDIDLDGIDPLTIACIPFESTVTVTDAAGNTGECDFQISINNSPPTANCRDFTIGLRADGTVEIEADRLDDNSTDDCTTDLEFSIDRTLFDCDDLGANTVELTVTDASGLSSTCESIVTIIEENPPVAECSDISIFLNSAGRARITPADVDNGSADACGNVDLSISEDLFECEDKGPNNVILTVIDESGNIDECTAVVTVDDERNPTVTCIDDFTISLGTAPMVLSVSHFIESSADNCGIMDETASPRTFDCDDIGTPVTVTVEVTDLCENTATCEVVVTIEDIDAPSCTLIAPGMEFPANAVIALEELLETYIDNCNTVSANSTISQNIFDCNELGTQTINVTVSDDSGNVSLVCNTTVEIIDPSVPVCVSNDITVELGSNGSYTLSAADSLAIYAGSTGGCDGTIVLTYTAPLLCNDISAPVCAEIVVTTSTGLRADCKAFITVEDNIPPSIDCVADMTLDLDADGEVNLTPSMIIDDASDNCGFTQAINLSMLNCTNKDTPATVTATATDLSGNATSCTTVITVEDNTDPTCVLQSGLVFSPEETITVAAVLQSFDDNCATVSSSSTVTPDMFSCADVPNSPLPITVTVNDDCGNSGTCTVLVSIIDDGAPMAVCQDITLGLNANGEVSIQGVELDGGSSTPCGSTELDFSAQPSIFDCDDLGVNDVVLTVTSNSGATDQCTATVTIEDALAPTIVCPSDQTIPCTANPNPLTQFGNATATDNCDLFPMVTVAVTDLTNDCGIGDIWRTFTATDSQGNSSMCRQIITVDEPANPITSNDITLDPGVINLVDCVDPNNLPMFPPTVDTSNADCFDIEILFTDFDATPNGPTCVDQILRTWQVIDHCQDMTWELVQTININDITGPIISNAPNDTIIEIDSTMSCSRFLMLPADVDTCGGGFTVMNDSPYADDNDSADASGTYTGSSNVTITAEDDCGNVSTHSYSVDIVDVTAFIKTCDKIIVTIQSNLMVDVDVALSDAEFCSSCPVTGFQMSWSDTDPNMDIMTVDCSFLGITNYTMYFYQNGMLLGDCTSLLQVLDGNGFCPTENRPAKVVGEVHTEDLEMVSEVDIKLDGSPFDVMTDDHGQYAFPSMMTGGEYMVVPSKDKDYLNGVSTADLIAIQKHILGVDLLDSPYKLIAADTDNSGSITSIDLIELRKLILGVYDDLPENTSWRMIDAGYTFVDPLNPFIYDFPEEYMIHDFDENMVIDFIGVKIGDVNNSVVASILNEEVRGRESSRFTFEFEDKLHAVGDIVTLTFESAMLNAQEGLQMALAIDPAKADLLYYDTHVSDLKDENIFNSKSSNALSLSWNRTTSTDVDKLFSVSMRVKAAGWTSELVSLDQSRIKAETYSAEGISELGIDFDASEVEENDFVLYQNQPNPWSESTTIRFYTPESGTARVAFFDVDGRLLLTKNVQTTIGINDVAVLKHELPTTGVIYYEVVTDHHKRNSKMLLVK